MMETVGFYLKKERESKNISIPELSQLTKISELYLKYIEKDEFDKLPQGPYVKGYIASYSRLIGGNVDEAISLYEALNKKPTQTEDVQPKPPVHNGKNRLPEKPKTTERKKPKVSLSGKAISFLSSIASSIPINSASFKAAGTSIKNIGASIRTNGKGFDTVASLFKRIASSRSWLYAFVALLGIAILVLTGFGFYHLFVYDPNPLPVVDLPHLQDKETRTIPEGGSEKPVLPSPSADGSSAADQLKGHSENTEAAEPSKPPEPQQLPTPLATDPDAATPRTQLTTEGSAAASNSTKPTGTPLSGSLSATENTDPSLTSAGTENQATSDQSVLTDAPSPESTTVDAPLTVLQASVCAEIKNRMPAGVDTSFPVSTQRVFVWNAIEARQFPTKIRHIYYLDGQKISDVTLDVRSAYWRTWSAKSLSNERYRGEWRVDIATAGGKVLRRLYFEVR
jgi:cytoskeletal protein RodZ